MSGPPPEDEPGDEPGSRRGALIGLVVVVLLIAAVVVVAQQIRGASHLQDCVQSGRTDCAPVRSP